MGQMREGRTTRTSAPASAICTQATGPASGRGGASASAGGSAAQAEAPHQARMGSRSRGSRITLAFTRPRLLAHGPGRRRASRTPQDTRMRILNVGDFNWMTGREGDTANVDLFAIRQKLSRAAVRAGHLVVEFSDRAVSRTRAPLRIKALGRAACNTLFLRLVDEVRPELILLHFADDLSNATLAAARALSKGVRIVDVNIDPLPSPRTRARLLARREAVDATFVTTAGPTLAELAGARSFVAFMPNPVDAAVETGRAFADPALRSDLVFPAGDDSPRQLGEARLRPSQVLADLSAALPELRVASPGLGQPRLRGRVYFEALEGARMGLSLSRWSDQPLYASDRMAHMLGSGLLTFVDARSGFQALYGDDALATYTDLDDLKRQIRAFASDDARLRATAERGWRRTFELFEAGRVFDYLLAQVFEDAGAKDAPWPSQRWRR